MMCFNSVSYTTLRLNAAFLVLLLPKAYLLLPLDHKLVSDTGAFVSKGALGTHAHAALLNLDEGTVRLYKEHYERQDFPWHDCLNIHQKVCSSDESYILRNRCYLARSLLAGYDILGYVSYRLTWFQSIATLSRAGRNLQHS